MSTPSWRTRRRIYHHILDSIRNGTATILERYPFTTFRFTTDLVEAGMFADVDGSLHANLLAEPLAETIVWLTPWRVRRALRAAGHRPVSTSWESAVDAYLASRGKP